MMMGKSRIKLRSPFLPLFAVGILLAGLASAQVAKQGSDVLSSLAFTSDKLSLSQSVENFDDVQTTVPIELRNGWAAFRLAAPAEWRSSVDPRNGQIAMAEGGNIAWVPGRGNSLRAADLGGKGGQPDLAMLDSIARGFLPRVASLLGVEPSTLVLDQGRSGQPNAHNWFVDYNVVRDGLVVEGARVVFRVNNGNLIQFGTENLPVRGSVVPKLSVSAVQALDALSAYVGGFQRGDKFLDEGSLHLLPAAVNQVGGDFVFGKGRGLVKVWQFTFHRAGITGTWRARIDATTGEMLDFQDVNDYAGQATGGVYMSSPTVAGEVVRPMPFADFATGLFGNSAGIFGGTATTSALNGQYVRIVDTCGSIAKTADGSGNLVFGTSTGTDCVTPGSGGACNTHSARNQFYHVNRIKDVGR